MQQIVIGVTVFGQETDYSVQITVFHTQLSQRFRRADVGQ